MLCMILGRPSDCRCAICFSWGCVKGSELTTVGSARHKVKFLCRWGCHGCPEVTRVRSQWATRCRARWTSCLESYGTKLPQRGYSLMFRFCICLNTSLWDLQAFAPLILSCCLVRCQETWHVSRRTDLDKPRSLVEVTDVVESSSSPKIGKE